MIKNQEILKKTCPLLKVLCFSFVCCLVTLSQFCNNDILDSIFSFDISNSMDHGCHHPFSFTSADYFPIYSSIKEFRGHSFSFCCRLIYAIPGLYRSSLGKRHAGGARYLVWDSSFRNSFRSRGKHNGRCTHPRRRDMRKRWRPLLQQSRHRSMVEHNVRCAFFLS